MQTTINNSSLGMEVQKSSPNFCSIAITVPATLVNSLYGQAVISQQKTASAFGFHKRETPTAYIEQNYQSNLIEHVKEFLLRYIVLGFLHLQILKQKILVVGQPRLTEITIAPEQDALFNFELSLFSPINFQEWKYLPFKAPKRKNYKDLDRQVETFLEEEIEAKEKYTNSGIHVGDWVNFNLSLLNDDNDPVLGTYNVNVWLKIGDEEPDRPFQDIFVNKKVGDTFACHSKILQEYFSDILAIRYFFGITILEILPYAYFCLEQFKYYFRIKNNKEMYQRLIEVFSYRNDLSQRRTTVEEALKLLFSKHRFEIPNYLILRQQKNVMEAIAHNPDYHVYRAQKDFKECVKELAEKQIREEIFLDQLAYEDDVQVSNQDMKAYLNLTKRPRTREFLYFDPHSSKQRGQEVPILTQELYRICLREKTINHVIYHLTKK